MIDYDAAKRIAEAGGDDRRTALACLTDAAPELLYFLAGDAAVPVRAAVAANPATPAQADSLLAADPDPHIRALVGQKLAPQAANLAPPLTATHDRLQRLAWNTLCSLAADTAVMVRAVIAEELKAMPDAPRALILLLAQDTAMEVAAPVIRLSPLLTEADLLALVAHPPVPQTVTAIARRPQLSEVLCDAIIAHADPESVGVLLDNPSAMIREATLDALIANAAEHIDWHERLVRRPVLPVRAARALAGFIAEHLLETLAARQDLEPKLARLLRQRVTRRLQAAPDGGHPGAVDAAGPAANDPASITGPDGARIGPAAASRTPESSPVMDPEGAFEVAGLRGDRAVMMALLAGAAGMPLAAVQQAARLRSAKGLISLCWKAGFRPHVGGLAQTVLGHLPPSGVMPASPLGGWPLTPDEMLWQLELLTDRDAQHDGC